MNASIGVVGPELPSTTSPRTCVCHHRIIIVSNQLPIKAKRNGDGSWDFEWDKWGLMKQAGVWKHQW